MMDESTFGSSEYSAEAEELFAQYLLARDVGEPIDFESFAEEHEEWTEELYGLHTDWDNVRGLLGRLERAKGSGTEAEVDAVRQEAAEVVAAPVVPTETVPSESLAFEEGFEPQVSEVQAGRSSRSMSTTIALGVLGLAVLGVGYVAFDFYRAGEVLAAESHRLTLEGEQTRELLAEEREEHGELRGQHQLLTVDLQSEREVRELKERELAAEQEALLASRAETELARSEMELAQAELQLEELRAEVLALLVACESLRGAPALTEPTLREDRGELDAWRSEVADVIFQREALTSKQAELGEQVQVEGLQTLTQATSELARLDGRVRAELGLLKRVRVAVEELGAESSVVAPEEVLPFGLVLVEGETEEYRDLAAAFGGGGLVRVPGDEDVFLASWDLSGTEEALARRLGYRRLSRVEARALAQAAGLELPDGELPGWGLGVR